ncbi:MAG: hypothetical protein ACSLE6_15825 [Mycobacterium sp.]
MTTPAFWSNRFNVTVENRGRSAAIATWILLNGTNPINFSAPGP